MLIAVIGGGPAGLRAAEVASQLGAESGVNVTLFDAMPSVGRKFLVAGHGGLNLTNAEPFERFVARYAGPGLEPQRWRSLLQDFDAGQLRDWAAGLGVETFAAGTGRVYPKTLRAAPLLRRWMERLRAQGVKFGMRHRWTGIERGTPLRLHFATPGGEQMIEADAVILAMGGASWPQTGSTGGWVDSLHQLGIEITPFQPANCGWEVAWPESIRGTAEGLPLKNLAASAGDVTVRGELLVTRHGLEGGAIYQLGPQLRSLTSPALRIDFKPDSTVEQLVARISKPGSELLAKNQRALRLTDAAAALLREFSGAGEARTPAALAAAIKCCEVPLLRPRSIAEAISSAGGVAWSEMTEDLMLRKAPGIFVSGEMIDWEAPTGGYLIQGCFATGTRAGNAAVKWLRKGGA